MTRPRIAIAHDYLTQRGGAERVVLSLVRAFPEAVVHTTLYDPDHTYPEFRDVEIRTSTLNRSAFLRHHHRAAFPVLAPASSQLHIDADVTVISSSGWAHGFDYSGQGLVYCHAPARWLYQSRNYVGGPLYRSPMGWGLALARPALRRWDRHAALRADRYVCNSTVVRSRIMAAYSIDAEVVPAPFAIDTTEPRQPVDQLADWDDGYLLIVSRLLPYKNVDAAIEAVRGTERRLVVVGTGPLAATLKASAPSNVRFTSGLTDAQLAWVYSHAQMLIAPSLEDYGLTPLEAGAFGKPTVALGAGGYLDTITEGVNGLFFDAPQPSAIAAGVARAEQMSWSPDALAQHMHNFSEEVFVERMRREAEQVLTTSR